MELRCILKFKNPCHIGYGTGAQVRDFRNKPYIPSIILATQIYSEALRFAIPLNRQISPPKVSDGVTPDEPNIVKIKGQEFFKNDIYFSLEVNERDLDIYLAALKSLQNTGIGANTSQGFGYNQIIIVNPDGIPKKLREKFSELFKEEKYYNPSLVRLIQSIFSRIKRNWGSWKRAYANIGPFVSRTYYKINVEKKIASNVFRGELRRKLLEITGIKHKGSTTVCSPRDVPCPVCKLMGYMGGKSKVIVRSFSGKQGHSIYVIGENLSPQEKELLEKALGENYQLVLEETIKDYVS
ncbi:hypothetical protein H5T89_04890 [bacterium]|nr:hypothetical protein [bacterium]